MTPELLEEVGRALYGPQWQTPLARALNVDDRMLRRWISGDAPIPPGVKKDCARIVDEVWLRLQTQEQNLWEVRQHLP